MQNKLFVGGISFNSTEDTLKEFFSEVGEVLSVKIIYDRETGRPRGFGFVEMVDEETAKKAIDDLDQKELDGRTLNITLARPQENR